MNWVSTRAVSSVFACASRRSFCHSASAPNAAHAALRSSSECQPRIQTNAGRRGPATACHTPTGRGTLARSRMAVQSLAITLSISAMRPPPAW
jgi:hypothetical protein